jgi:hypothetical protein
MTGNINTALVATATLSQTINKVLDYIEEPCNRLDFDDFERGEAAMAAAIFWIISDNLDTGVVYGAE